MRKVVPGTIQMDGNGLRETRHHRGGEDGVSLDRDEMREIAGAWIALHQLPEASPKREDKFWSFERLSDLTHDDPEAAWNIIQMIRQEGSDHILSILAAGPVEDLLVHHGDRFVDRIEALAEHDAQFRKLLGAVWQNSMSPEIWKRIRAVAGPSW